MGRSDVNILRQWLDDLRFALTGEEPAELRVTGHVGAAFTPRGLTDTVCCPRSAEARGIHAETRMVPLHVVTPPPTEKDHAEVQAGLRSGTWCD